MAPELPPLPEGETVPSTVDELLSLSTVPARVVDPHSDPTEEEWQTLDFLRSQHEELFQSTSSEFWLKGDQMIVQLRESLASLGFPVHDPRALHTTLLTSALLYKLISEECDDCPAAIHAFFAHVQYSFGALGLLVRELCKDAGVRPPIEPGPDDFVPSSDPNSPHQVRWRDVSKKFHPETGEAL